MRSRPDVRALCSRILTCSLSLLAVLLPPASVSAPAVVEEVAKLTSPDPSYLFGGRVAVSGDTIIVTGSRSGVEEDPDVVDQAAFLFQRDSSGSWNFVRTLVEVRQNQREYFAAMSVGIDGAAGIVMYKTSADYDNAVLSPNPQTTLFRDDFEVSGAPEWTTVFGTWNVVTDTTSVFAQTSLAGDGRTVTGMMQTIR